MCVCVCARARACIETKFVGVSPMNTKRRNKDGRSVNSARSAFKQIERQLEF